MTNTGASTTVREPRWMRARHALLDQVDQRSFVDATRSGGSRRGPGAWRRRGPAVIAAAAVHLVTLSFLVLGLWLLLSRDGWPWKVAACVPILAFIALRPRLPRSEDEFEALTRESAPALFSLLDDVAGKIDGPVPDRVVVDGDLNASVGRDRFSRVMVLGAPWWFAHTHQGRIALLAHELGHLAHGDLADAIVVGAAHQTLDHWYGLGGGDGGALRDYLEDDDWGAEGRLSYLAGTPVRAIAAACSAGLAVLDGPANRRRELWADRMSVEVAGTDGALDSIDVILSHARVQAAVQRAVLGREQRDVWEAVTEQMQATGPGVRARERELAEVRVSRLDSTHPADHVRVKLIEAFPRTEPTVWRDAAGWAAIDAEIARALPEVTRAVRDSFRGT